MTYAELITLIRPRIYDERSPITVLKTRCFENPDDAVTVDVTDTDIFGTVDTPEADVIEEWTYTRDNDVDIQPLISVIENTAGWEVKFDASTVFFLQENLMSFTGRDAKQKFVEFKVRYRFSDAEIEREIDGVIKEIDVNYEIGTVPLNYKMFIVNSVCYRLLLIRAVDSFGSSDIDVRAIEIPGVSVEFKTTSDLWAKLADYYKQLIEADGIGNDQLSMPFVQEDTVTHYDPFYGVQTPHKGAEKPISLLISAKIRGASPDYNVLFRWAKPDNIDFKEYRILRSDSEIDIPTDGTPLTIDYLDKQDIYKTDFIDDTVVAGQTYYYRVMVILNDLNNRETLYSLSNQLVVGVPA